MELDPTRIFVTLALTFGSVFALLTPPFQSPDEQNHFFRAWQVSEGQFFPKQTNDARLGGQIPESLDSLRRAFMFLKNDYGAKTSFSRIYAHLSQPLRSEKNKFTDFPNTAIYSPTAYLPQATAIFFLKFFEVPPLFLLFAGRLANLFVWVLLVCKTLKIMPLHGRVLAFLALLPGSLVISASFNADVLTNGLCFWLVAFFLSRSLDSQNSSNFGKLKPFRSLVVFCASVLVGLNKIVFAPLVLLVFLPGKTDSEIEKPGKRKSLIFNALLTAMTFAAAIFWAKISSNAFLSFDKYNPEFRNQQTLNEGVEPEAQIRFVLQNPFQFFKIAAKSYAESLPSTAAHVVGKFGWEKNYVPFWVVGLLWLALISLVLSEKTPFQARSRLFSSAVALFCCALFSVTMYALWSPVASPELRNLQGRYFVPILPLFALVLGNGWLSKHAAKIWAFSLLTLFVGLTSMVLETFFRYYS